MSTHPHTGQKPKVRGQSDSYVVTIPKGLVRELDIEHEERPDWEYDSNEREITMSFGD